MEQWAANTLRTLLIIFIAGLVIIASLLLLLLSTCAFSSQSSGGIGPNLGYVFLGIAAIVVTSGVVIMIKLARGIVRSHSAPELAPAGGTWTLMSPRPASPQSDLPISFSPATSEVINRLVYALAAQIGLSAITWFTGQLKYWTVSRPLLPHNWTLLLLAPFILYHIPYALLIYHLIKKLDRRTLTYAMVVPSVLILEGLFSLSVVTYTYIHEPVGFLLVAVPWLIHFAILALAWKAVQEIGIHPDPGSMIVAALATYIYFYVVQGATPLLYRFGMG